MKEAISQDEINRYSNLISSIANSVVGQVSGATKEIGLVKYRFGLSALKDRNVHVYIVDNKVTLDLSINVIYGYSVPDVVCSIQESIKSKVEQATPFEVSSINVYVANVIFE